SLTLSDSIEGCDLAFRYPDGTGQVESAPRVFQHLNIEVPARRITVLSGPSGAGKSTLADLLLGLLVLRKARYGWMARPWPAPGEPRGGELVPMCRNRASSFTPALPTTCAGPSRLRRM